MRLRYKLGEILCVTKTEGSNVKRSYSLTPVFGKQQGNKVYFQQSLLIMDIIVQQGTGWFSVHDHFIKTYNSKLKCA